MFPNHVYRLHGNFWFDTFQVWVVMGRWTIKCSFLKCYSWEYIITFTTKTQGNPPRYLQVPLQLYSLNEIKWHCCSFVAEFFLKIREKMLGWVILLALESRCTVSLWPHPIIVGVFAWIKYFQPTCGNPWACLWSKWLKCKDLANLFAFKLSRFYHWKDALIFEVHLVPRDVYVGITSKIVPTWRWNNPGLHIGGNI